tara:strand:- start:1139 stop:1354 length:216 start_codon:yes stop_codon:yes gene_type:complete
MEVKFGRIPEWVWFVVVAGTALYALPHYLNWAVRAVEPMLVMQERIEAQGRIYDYQADLRVEQIRKAETTP